MESNRKNKCNLAVKIFNFYFCCIICAYLAGCKVTYSFSGASISPLVKTLSVQYFQNRAPLVQPGLSQYINRCPY